jgi:8-oxo-dGTP pyrophosphatase MutT (NUDIX family)
MNEHKQAMLETGFWGRAAAGALILARSTSRLLIAHRAEGTLQAGTWGTWGGAVDAGETAEQAVTRELHEEAGFDGRFDAHPLMVFEHDSGFTYSNFLVVVEQEFAPVLNWETQNFGWFDYGDWPTPLHFGLEQLLDHQDSRTIITSIIRSK